MTEDVIPDNVKQFLLKHVDSVAQWEGLLLIKSRPEETWTKDTIAKNLYLTETDAAQLLSHLCTHGFIIAVKEGGRTSYRYQPKTPALASLIEQTGQLYKTYLIPITHIIHSKSKSRVQEFADAFRIRKD